MGELVPHYVHAIASLRKTLEETSSALAQADLHRLLESEARIEAALVNVPMRGLGPEARDLVVAEVEQARAALARCRRLGAALQDFIRVSQSAHGLDHGYGRQTMVASQFHSLDTTA